MTKSVFISGAAAGIGRATALKLQDKGYLVGAYDIQTDALADLGDDGFVTGYLDVTSPDSWTTAMTEFMSHTGGTLDVLINNAGVLHFGTFEELPLQTHLQTVRVNVDGVIIGSYVAFPYLKKTKGAQVINLCSASAMYGQPDLSTYSASKFYVRGLSEALELEWKNDDITVTAIWPLYVATAMTQDKHSNSTNSLGVRLSAEDVADEIVKVLTGRQLPLVPRKVHRAVGTQAKVLQTASNFTPPWALRLANKYINGR